MGSSSAVGVPGFVDPPSGVPGSWLAYVTVVDVDQRTRLATEAGAEVISEPTTAPGVGRIAVIRDPLGAAVAFFTYENNGG